MDEKFAKMVRDRSNYKKKREEKYKADSRERLATILKKKIKTTMIGAISSVEDHFGFLWGGEEGSLTPEQKQMKELFMQMRFEVLDKGNAQSRNVDAELAQYDVHWNKFTMTLPVEGTKTGNEDTKDE